MAFLTDRTLATGVTFNDLIHIVITGDTSQNPAGSSYKATIGQVTNLVNSVVITGGTYNSSTGEITFANSSGGTFTVSGFVSGFTDTYVSGGTYTAGTATFTNTTGGTFTLTGFTEPFSGGSGNCITDFYVTNIYGCSPITIYDSIKSVGSESSGNLSYGYGLSVSGTGDYSVALNRLTLASGNASIAIGNSTSAIGTGSMSQGYVTQSIGNFSHAEGNNCISIGDFSHAEGSSTVAVGYYQHVNGTFNLTASTQGAFIIGNGVSDFNRSNLVFAANNDFNIYGNLNVSGAQTISTTGMTASAITLNSGITYNGISYSGNVDLSLFSPTSVDGLKIIIKDEGGYAGTYRIRITPSSGTIDGNSYVDMNINYMSLTLVARNNNWWII